MAETLRFIGRLGVVEEVQCRFNLECPTGITSTWRLKEGRFKMGEPNPCPCDIYPATHRHFLFSC